MPVVAVFAGIASAVGGVTAFSAAAGFTLANVAAGLAVVGGISTALGAITGNKKLQKFGMITGIAGAALGGLSSLASKAASPYSLAGEGGSGLGLKVGSSALDSVGAQALQSVGTEVSGLGGSLGSAMDVGMGGALGLGADSLIKSSFLPSALDSSTSLLGGGGGLARLVPDASSIAPGAFAGNPGLRLGGGVTMPTAPTTGGLMGSAMDALKGLGSSLGKDSEMTKIGLGAISAFGQAKMAQAQIEEQRRIAEQDRARYNASISNQRQAF